MSKPANRNYAFSEAFVEELALSGLHHACICPGSRSTPLVLSLAKERRIKTWVHLDERSAAYFALGISRSLNEPALVVSTSGTAAANFFPAVVEARYSQAPILIVTADRPPELLDWGANQTIDQNRLYGNYSKWFLNLTACRVAPDILRYVRETTCRAVATANQSPAGPVHINFSFGEPLVPKQVSADFDEENMATTINGTSGRAQRAYTRVENGPRSVTLPKIKELALEIRDIRRGVIVCGPQPDPSFPDALTRLAHVLSFPVLADPLSQVRCGQHDRKLVIDSYDVFLRSEKCVNDLRPELFLRFGTTPTSKSLQSFITQHNQARHILIREGDWQDPMHVATDVLQANPAQFARDLTISFEPRSDTEWCDRWSTVNRSTRKTMSEGLDQIEEIFEGKIFAELSLQLPSKTTLFAGNSMPVRDLDTFYPSTSRQIRFLANRGVSGIDGVVSTALGVGSVTAERTVLVLGDLSFYHDLSGLLAAKQYRPNTTIIIVNNNGGGIFSFLPQREYPETFERYFATPHGLTFQPAAALYDLQYLQVASWPEFGGSVSNSLKLQGPSIIELKTDRDRNLRLHEDIWSTATKAAEKSLTEWG